MAHEIERKFLVKNDSWRALADGGRSIEQAYLAIGEAASVRVRIELGARATLTIKSRAAELRRHEFEYEIEHTDATRLMQMRTGASIDKVRYRVPSGTLTWEIDVFRGANAGLVIAEIELVTEQQSFERPEWLGQEITSVERYYNSSLAMHPFSQWRAGR